MEPQTQSKKPGTGDTVSITVSITQDARRKLRKMKGILGYSTVDNTVNTAVEMVEMRKVFAMAMEAQGLVFQIEPTEEIKVKSKESTSITDEERKMIDFCEKLLIDLKLEDMDKLNTFIDSDIVLIENKLLLKTSPVGHIPDDTPEWKE